MAIVARILRTTRLVSFATGLIVSTPMVLSDVRAQEEDPEREDADACASLGCPGGDLVCAEYDETRVLFTISFSHHRFEFLWTETITCYESRS